MYFETCSQVNCLSVSTMPMQNRDVVTPLDEHPHYSSWLEVVKAYTKCHRLMSVRLAELDLSVAQHEVLLALGREKGLSQVELASRLLVARSNITAMLKRMEGSGLVERSADENDGRTHRVSLTAAGRRLLRRSARVHGEIVDLMIGELSNEQIRVVKRSMQLVGNRLSEALRLADPR